jgi:hypothetical protein
MPQLKPYDAGNVALQPSERGIDAQVQRGRRTAAFYNQAANEISGGAQSIATAANDEAASVRDIGSGRAARDQHGRGLSRASGSPNGSRSQGEVVRSTE